MMEGLVLGRIIQEHVFRELAKQRQYNKCFKLFSIYPSSNHGKNQNFAAFSLYFAGLPYTYFNTVLVIYTGV